MFASLRRSLRGRLIVLVGMVAVASCLLAGLLIWRAYTNERAAVFRELGATARAVASLVDQRVENLEALLQGLITAEELTRGDLAQFYARAAQITKPGQQWVVVLDPNGQQVANTRLPYGSALPLTPPPAEIEATLITGRTYVSNLTQGAVANAPVLFVSAGAFDGRQLRYRISLVVTPDEFARGLDMQKIAPGYVVAVIDRSGHIAARSQSPERFVGRKATPDIVAAAQSRREAFSYSTTIDGLPVLAAVAPAMRSGWSVALGAPLRELHASALRLLVLGLLTSFGILAAATLVAWWIARAAIHDVTELVADTRAIANGALPAHTTAELAETRAIAESLRATAEELHRELRERRRAQAELAAAKEELARANSDLEEKVAERTASLAELVQQLEEFTYSISHDLRAPVRSMIGFAEVLMEDHGRQLAPEAQSLLQRVIRNGERLDRMINDLLAFSRVSRENVELTPVNPTPLLHEAISEHAALAASSAGFSIEGELPLVLAHPASLKQVLTNLLTNAVKFVPPDTAPRVRIYSESANGHARLWICDNGIGIQPQFHSRLFRMFERVHVNRDYEGSGIGLAIVRRAVERMEGRVGVESNGTAGSCFWVELKRAPETSAAVDGTEGERG